MSSSDDTLSEHDLLHLGKLAQFFCKALVSVTMSVTILNHSCLYCQCPVQLPYGRILMLPCFEVVMHLKGIV